MVMVYQLISLNVAVNSYDNALITLLVSNQFVEIKGSVFKKFEKDNLFQITCAGTWALLIETAKHSDFVRQILLNDSRYRSCSYSSPFVISLN